MHCTVLVIVILSVRPSVCLSVTLVDCVHMVRPTIMISSPMKWQSVPFGTPVYSSHDIYNEWCCVVLLVNRLCECWKSAMETVTKRQQTLDSMLADSREFEQLYIETDRWIVQTSQRCQQEEIGNDVATVKQQKDIVEVPVANMLAHCYYHHHVFWLFMPPSDVVWPNAYVFVLCICLYAYASQDSCFCLCLMCGFTWTVCGGWGQSINQSINQFLTWPK